MGEKSFLALIIAAVVASFAVGASMGKTAPRDDVQTSSSRVSSAKCDPNYASPPCVPVASDVDCAGGRGNGPAYVRGPVHVIGSDVYGLDRDGDGIGCE